MEGGRRVTKEGKGIENIKLMRARKERCKSLTLASSCKSDRLSVPRVQVKVALLSPYCSLSSLNTPAACVWMGNMGEPAFSSSPNQCVCQLLIVLL